MADELHPEIRRARTLARVMDDYYLDPILGFLLPGIGDLIGSLIGVYIVIVAARRGLSPVLLARMLLNLALDAAIGALPIIGDIGDIAFKANDANLALLVDRHAIGGKATGRDWLVLAAAVGALAAVVGVVSYVVYRVLHAFA